MWKELRSLSQEKKGTETRWHARYSHLVEQEALVRQHIPPTPTPAPACLPPSLPLPPLLPSLPPPLPRMPVVSLSLMAPTPMCARRVSYRQSTLYRCAGIGRQRP